MSFYYENYPQDQRDEAVDDGGQHQFVIPQPNTGEDERNRQKKEHQNADPRQVPLNPWPFTEMLIVTAKTAITKGHSVQKTP